MLMTVINASMNLMKSYPTQFSRLLYYKDLPIVHLFDAMHIGVPDGER